MEILVPYDPTEPKRRLRPALDAPERQAFAEAMLTDVIGAIDTAGQVPVVLTPAESSLRCPCEVVHDARSLSTAVTAQISRRLTAGAPAVGVIMADCALVTPETVERFVSTPGPVVLAPGRGGGTNGLVIREPAFTADYHGASILDHRQVAATLGSPATEVDSMRLSTDIDEPVDLPEVLLHSDGQAAALLRSWGFTLSRDDGRVGVTR